MLKLGENGSLCSQFYSSVPIWKRRNICIKRVEICAINLKNQELEEQNGEKKKKNVQKC